jgi:hypothetical protein
MVDYLEADVRRCKRPFCEGSCAIFGGAQKFCVFLAGARKKKLRELNFSKFFREQYT